MQPGLIFLFEQNLPLDFDGFTFGLLKFFFWERIKRFGPNRVHEYLCPHNPVASMYVYNVLQSV